MLKSSGSLKPRLLVLTSTYPRWSGDPEPGFVHELAKRLTDDFDVTVLGPHAPETSLEETMDGVRVVRYRYAPARLETLVNDGGIITNLRRQPWKWLLVPPFLIAQLLSALRLIRCVHPDVIHAHWLIPQGLIAAVSGQRAPYLVTSHGADLFTLRSRPFAALKRVVARRAAAITVVSRAMLDELRKLGMDLEKVQVQPMGVDLQERFTPNAAVLRSCDEILFVGRLVEKKGLRHLLDAMPAILRERPTAFLTVAGFGPAESVLRQQTAALGLDGKVTFRGALPQAELPSLYCRAAVLVAPFVRAASGDQEGLGLVMVEALGCGCPVIASDLPAIRDIVSDPVPPADANALAERVVALLSQTTSLRQQRSTRLRATIASRFDWRVVAADYSKLLQRLATSGGMA